jgi:hypothetical protein
LWVGSAMQPVWCCFCRRSVISCQARFRVGSINGTLSLLPAPVTKQAVSRERRFILTNWVQNGPKLQGRILRIPRGWPIQQRMPRCLATGLSFGGCQGGVWPRCEIARFDAGLDRVATQRHGQGAARGPDLCNTSGLADAEPRYWAACERHTISPRCPARPARPASPRLPKQSQISSPHVAAANGAPGEALRADG